MTLVVIFTVKQAFLRSTEVATTIESESVIY